MYDDRPKPSLIQDSINATRLELPTYGQTMKTSAFSVSTAPSNFANDLLEKASGIPQTDPYRDALKTMRIATEGYDLPIGQDIANFGASAIGYLNPIYWAGGLGAAAVGRVGTSLFSRAAGAVAPEALATFGRASIRPVLEGTAEKVIPRTMGELGEHLTKAMTVGTAVSVPEAFHDAYDQKTQSFDITGGATASLAGGVLAMGLDVVGIVGGTIFSKMRGAKAKKSFEDGQISKEEFEWMETYNNEPGNKEKLRDLGVKILMKEGYPIDTAQRKMIITLLKNEDHEKLQTGIIDQLLEPQAGESKSALSDYMTHSNIDRLSRDNEKFLEGLKGFVDFLKNRQETHATKLESFKRAREKESLSHITEEHPLAQKKILASLKKFGYDIRNTSLSIPKNLRKRLSQEKKIASLKNRPNSESTINEIKEKLEPTHSVKEELSHLEKHFLGEEPLSPNFKDSHDYHRIVDLAHSSEKARALLHHIDYKAELQNQAAYKSIIELVIKKIESGITQMADPEKVVSYMKNRISERAPTSIETSVGDKMIKPSSKDRLEGREKSVQENYKDNINYGLGNDKVFFEDLETTANKINDKTFAKALMEEKERYFQFKENEQANQTLISCIFGAMKND